jgi:uncharacterized membrane protein (DUF2068 family)
MPARHTTGYYGFKTIGTLKLISGVAAVIAGLGATHFLAHDPGPKLERAVSHFGLDPQNRFIHTVISSVTGIDRKHLHAIEAGTFFYALLHMVEGIGLILEKAWAGYLVVVATSTLIPLEIYEIAKKPTLLRFSLFFLNVGIVIYLIVILKKEHASRSQHSAKPQ